MNTSSTPVNAELQALAESNEALLKSKARLQQDLLSLKKSIAVKDRDLQDQEALVQEQAGQLEESRQLIRELKASGQQLQEQVKSLEQEIGRLEKLNQELQQRSWLQRLMGKTRKVSGSA